MKRVKTVRVSGETGFTLVEVLLALAIAALGFGVVLHSIGLQLTLVATCVDRHQMLMYASEALEKSLSRGTLGDEEVEPVEEPIGLDIGTDEDTAKSVARYFYKIETKPVTADPRVQQVSVTVRNERGRVKLAAYRLRVKRNE